MRVATALDVCYARTRTLLATLYHSKGDVRRCKACVAGQFPKLWSSVAAKRDAVVFVRQKNGMQAGRNLQQTVTDYERVL